MTLYEATMSTEGMRQLAEHFDRCYAEFLRKEAEKKAQPASPQTKDETR